MSPDLRRLVRALGTPLGSIRLLEQALTHRSAAAVNNERLEFLGDALLGFVIAQVLWERFPEGDEGRLSRLRASLVNKEALAVLARRLELGDYLRLGAGEQRTGGHARDSILADALEAVFAAVYLDRGLPATREMILSLFQGPLEAVSELGSSKDPKTRLQELLQANHRPLPEYEVIAIGGTQHAQTFRVRCTLGDSGESTEGAGTSRRRAEQQAAEEMLRVLDSDG